MRRSFRSSGLPLLAGVLVTASAQGCGPTPQPSGCSVDADCTSNAWCQEGACQAAYALTLTATGTARPDGKIHLSGSLPISVQVANGSPASVEIQVDGARVQVVGAPYSWTWIPSVTADGDHVVRAVARPGSRVYVSNEVGVVVDHAAPAAPSVSPVGSPTRSVTLDGTAEANATLKVYEDGTVLRTTEVPAGGVFHLAMTGLTDGPHSLSVTATDWAGNESGPARLPDTTVDTMPPAAPTIDAIPGATATTNLTVTGTAEAGSLVQLMDQGTPVGERARSSAGATWSVVLTLANGEHVLAATATDDAGNVSPASPAASFTVATAGVTIEGPTLTNLSNVTFTGKAPAGQPVEVTDGARTVASVTAAANATWTAAITLAEGPHDLVAHVSTLTSAPLHVVVDQTRPQIVSRTPVPDAVNVWTRDPITVTFSEPMDPATVGPDTVRVVGQGGGSVTTTSRLSEDGRELTIRITALPAVPDVLAATLDPGLRDLAGNALVDSPGAWSWTIPEWQDLANPIFNLGRRGQATGSIAVDARGTPVLAVIPHYGSGTGTPSVLRWSGTSWIGHDLPGLGALYYPPAVDVDGEGRPTPVWANIDGGSSVVPVWVARWIVEPPSWSEPLRLIVDPNTSRLGAWTVRVGPDGAPVVAWSEGAAIYLRRLGPSGLEAPWGPGAIAQTSVNSTALSIRWQGAAPVVTWSGSRSGDVLRWTGTTWSGIEFRPTVNGVFRSDASGLHPFDLVVDTAVSPATLSVRQWDEMGYATYPGCALCGTLNVDPSKAASEPAMAVDASGRPVVAWVESGALYVKRWMDAGWVRLGGNLHVGCPAGAVSAPMLVRIGVGEGGVVSVLWSSRETSLPYEDNYLCAKRYNR